MARLAEDDNLAGWCERALVLTVDDKGLMFRHGIAAPEILK
jgi:hypothetical protein